MIIEEFDKLKTKVLKYVLYKKRTEAEIRQKFSANIDENTLEEIIEFLKKEKYIDDDIYIEKLINEYINLNNFSIQEIKYKLLQKGLEKEKIEKYLEKSEIKEKILDYEIKSIKKIFTKKINVMQKEDILSYLLKKGFNQEIVYNIYNSMK